MSATTVSSSNAESLRSQQGSTSFEEVCHSRLHSLTSMSDELDAVSLPNIGNLAIQPLDGDRINQSSSPSVSSSQSHVPIAVPSDMDASAYEDDPHVYMNLSAIESKKAWDDIDRRPAPPTPPPETPAIRILPSGWHEYKTPGGRTYFYHHDHALGQWKPPRGNQMSASIIRRQKTNDSVNSADDSKNGGDEMSSTENIRVQQVTTFPVESTKQAFSSHSPIMGEGSVEEKQSSSIMSQSMTLPVHQHNASPMINSVDSGLGRSSISYKNQGFGMKAVADVMAESAIEGVGLKMSASKESVEGFFAGKCENAIMKGSLERMRISVQGVPVKKKEWCMIYAYLSPRYLMFYKNQKTAEKIGKHYEKPLEALDIRGAKVSFVDFAKYKDKKRKHVFSLTLYGETPTEFWFSCPGNEIESWYHSLRQAISVLPAPPQYPSPNTDTHSLQRRPSDSTQSVKNVSLTPLHILKGSPLRHSQKGKVKPTTSKDTVDLEGAPTRDSIIERLLRFFRSRPSVDQLKERGIYRPEPIFGSTLAAICQHDHTNVPRFITEITQLIESKGLNIDGIYRVSGNLSSIQKIRCQVDQDRYDVLRKEDDIHVLTGALKLFFRELSEPIFPVAMNKDFMASIRHMNAKTKLKAVDDLLSKLPLINKETLRVLFEHLLKVANNSSKNRMTVHSLAIMFGPALFSSEDKPLGGRSTGTVDKKNTNKKSKDKDKASDRKGSSEMANEPNQILAYKMIVQGQIVEFILQEYTKFSTFIHSNSISGITN